MFSNFRQMGKLRNVNPGLPNRWGTISSHTVSWIVPYVLFGVTFTVSWPEWLLHAAFHSFGFCLAAGLILCVVCSRATPIFRFASLTFFLLLFALPLLAVWSHIGFQGSAIGGLIPWSDASGFYWETSKLIDGHALTWSARRPLFVGILSTLLKLTGQNLQVTLAILTAITATSCAMLATEIRRQLGVAATAVVIIVVFFFYRSVGGVGAVLTEHLGLALGVVSCAVLWRGSVRHSLALYCLGMGLLTLALCARAGAFFVLPALIAVGTYSFRKASRYGAPRFLCWGFAAVITAFALNFTLIAIVRAPASDQMAFSNFSQTLYGLVVGGKGWGQIAIDYPEAAEGAEIYRLAYEAFKSDPKQLLIGSLKMWREYFPPRNYHAFAFVRSKVYSSHVQWSCYVLAGLGLLICVIRFRQAPYLMLAGATVGHVASIPFAPSIDAGLRIYAATLPILALLIGVGVGSLVRLPRLTPNRGALAWCTPDPKPTSESWSQSLSAAVIFGPILGLTSVIGPIVVYVIGQPPEVQKVACAADQRTLYVELHRGALLNVVDDPPDLKAMRSSDHVHSQVVSGPAGYPTIISVKNSGRYVRIQLASPNYLSLAEVQVFGVPISEKFAADTRNVAIGKSVSQSSLASGGVASRAVDGETNGTWDRHSVTHTNYESEAWWEVDLGSIHRIEKIAIWNRRELPERLSNFYVLVSEQPFAESRREVVPRIRLSNLTRHISRLPLKNDRDRFTPETTIADTFDVTRGHHAIFVAPTALVPADLGLIRACGNFSRDPVARNYGLFYASTVTRAATKQD